MDGTKMKTRLPVESEQHFPGIKRHHRKTDEFSLSALLFTIKRQGINAKSFTCRKERVHKKTF